MRNANRKLVSDLIGDFDDPILYADRPQGLTPGTDAFEYYTRFGVSFSDFNPSHRWVWRPDQGFAGEWWAKQHIYYYYGRNDATVNPNNTLRPLGFNGLVGFTAPGVRGSGYFSRIVGAFAATRTDVLGETNLEFDIEDQDGTFRNTILLTPRPSGADAFGAAVDGLDIAGGQIPFFEDDNPVIRYQGTNPGGLQLNDVNFTLDTVIGFANSFTP